MFPPTPDAVHQIAAERRADAVAAAEVHRVTRLAGRTARRRFVPVAWRRLVPRPGGRLDAPVARPRRA